MRSVWATLVVAALAAPAGEASVTHSLASNGDLITTSSFVGGCTEASCTNVMAAYSEDQEMCDVAVDEDVTVIPKVVGATAQFFVARDSLRSAEEVNYVEVAIGSKDAMTAYSGENVQCTEALILAGAPCSATCTNLGNTTDDLDGEGYVWLKCGLVDMDPVINATAYFDYLGGLSAINDCPNNDPETCPYFFSLADSSRYSPATSTLKDGFVFRVDVSFQYKCQYVCNSKSGTNMQEFKTQVAPQTQVCNLGITPWTYGTNAQNTDWESYDPRNCKVLNMNVTLTLDGYFSSTSGVEPSAEFGVDSPTAQDLSSMLTCTQNGFQDVSMTCFSGDVKDMFTPANGNILQGVFQVLCDVRNAPFVQTAELDFAYQCKCDTDSPSVPPSPAPSQLPTIEPTSLPSAKPTPMPSPNPTSTPSPAPTAVPTVAPTSSPTAVPTAEVPIPCPRSIISGGISTITYTASTDVQITTPLGTPFDIPLSSCTLADVFLIQTSVSNETVATAADMVGVTVNIAPGSYQNAEVATVICTQALIEAGTACTHVCSSNAKENGEYWMCNLVSNTSISEYFSDVIGTSLGDCTDSGDTNNPCAFGTAVYLEEAYFAGTPSQDDFVVLQQIRADYNCECEQTDRPTFLPTPEPTNTPTGAPTECLIRGGNDTQIFLFTGVGQTTCPFTLDPWQYGDDSGVPAWRDFNPEICDIEALNLTLTLTGDYSSPSFSEGFVAIDKDGDLTESYADDPSHFFVIQPLPGCERSSFGSYVTDEVCLNMFDLQNDISLNTEDNVLVTGLYSIGCDQSQGFRMTATLDFAYTCCRDPDPSPLPTANPSSAPTSAPSAVPTKVPTSVPSFMPSEKPTPQPTRLTPRPTPVPSTPAPTPSPTVVCPYYTSMGGFKKTTYSNDPEGTDTTSNYPLSVPFTDVTQCRLRQVLIDEVAIDASSLYTTGSGAMDGINVSIASVSAENAATAQLECNQTVIDKGLPCYHTCRKSTLVSDTQNSSVRYQCDLFTDLNVTQYFFYTGTDIAACLNQAPGDCPTMGISMHVSYDSYTLSNGNQLTDLDVTQSFSSDFECYCPDQTEPPSALPTVAPTPAPTPEPDLCYSATANRTMACEGVEDCPNHFFWFDDFAHPYNSSVCFTTDLILTMKSRSWRSSTPNVTIKFQRDDNVVVNKTLDASNFNFSTCGYNLVNNTCPGPATDIDICFNKMSLPAKFNQTLEFGGSLNLLDIKVLQETVNVMQDEFMVADDACPENEMYFDLVWKWCCDGLYEIDPTAMPSPMPTTAKPTPLPTALPTAAPTSLPTLIPAPRPSLEPTAELHPTSEPTVCNLCPSDCPVYNCTTSPTTAPVFPPTGMPRPVPSALPVPLPSAAPFPAPTTGSEPAPTTGSEPAPTTASVPAPSTASVPAPSTASVPAPSTASVPAPSTASVPAPSAAPGPAHTASPSAPPVQCPPEGNSSDDDSDDSTTLLVALAVGGFVASLVSFGAGYCLAKRSAAKEPLAARESSMIENRSTEMRTRKPPRAPDEVRVITETHRPSEPEGMTANPMRYY